MTTEEIKNQRQHTLACVKFCEGFQSDTLPPGGLKYARAALKGYERELRLATDRIAALDRIVAAAKGGRDMLREAAKQFRGLGCETGHGNGATAHADNIDAALSALDSEGGES